MKKTYQYFLIIFLWMIFFACPLFAEDIYVIGIKIAMRTSPGVQHKIVDMLTSGTKLKIVEYQKDWAHVKTNQGRSGWVLSKFLTRKVPDALLIKKLNKDNQEVMSRLKAIQDENKTLTVKNVTLGHIEEKYNKLKQESFDFLKLNAEYKEMMQQYEAQKSQIETLEDSLNNESKLWFLIGPGVFVVGLFFGLSTRKKKKLDLL